MGLTDNSGGCGCWGWFFLVILFGSFIQGIQEGDWSAFLWIFIPSFIIVVVALTKANNNDESAAATKSDDDITPLIKSSDNSIRNSIYENYDTEYDNLGDGDEDDDIDLDDDGINEEELQNDIYNELYGEDDYTFEDDDYPAYVLSLTPGMYHEVKAAFRRLLKLCKRMSNDRELRQYVLDHANDKDTIRGEYTNYQFYDFLKLMLGRDIVYLYEHLGYEAEIDFITMEGQLLLMMMMCMNGNKNLNNYSAFKHVIQDKDYINNRIRDNYESMFEIYKNQSEAGIFAKGFDDFSLVMIIMFGQKEEVYLEDMRNALYQWAVSVEENVGEGSSIAKSYLEEMKQKTNVAEDGTIEDNLNTENDADTISTMDDLNVLIGLKQVKKEVSAMKNFIEVNRRREEAGMKTPHISYHCVFTGNPGTGKTTVARIVAGIYKELGILKKGHLIETDRSGLVAEYVGQTAVKTNKVIDSALDGVLFIDEAYSLVGAGNEDFGKEAIATLVKRMEDNRDRIVVILAGYEDEMKQFIESNPGLRSRFNRYIHFEDYSADELTQIFLGMLKKYDFVIENQGEQVLTQHLNQCVLGKGKDFGNARYVRNLFERTIKAQAVRLAEQSKNDKPQLATITADDITAAIADNP